MPRFHIRFSFLIAASACVFFACSTSRGRRGVSDGTTVFSTTISNPLNQSRKDVFFLIDKNELPALDSPTYSAFINSEEAPSQYISDGFSEGLGILLPIIGAYEESVLSLRISDSPKKYTKRTQAELSHKVGGYFRDRKYIGGTFENVVQLQVPPAHTDHSWFIRYEGPGWESDLVGYRFYLDWRNGIDVFGKKVSEPILQHIGLDGFDSYHEMQPWGMDVLKVGKTLGVGSIAAWSDGRAVRVEKTDSIQVEISNNGNIYSSVNTRYFGWQIGDIKTDLESEIGIHAGSRLSRIQLRSSEELDNMATGLIKDPKARLIISGGELAYSYIATYGEQSLAGDKLGIAVIYPTETLLEITEDVYSHVVVMRPEGGTSLTYYFLGAWEQEQHGIKNEEEFEMYMDQTIKELSEPLRLN